MFQDVEFIFEDDCEGNYNFCEFSIKEGEEIRSNSISTSDLEELDYYASENLQKDGVRVYINPVPVYVSNGNEDADKQYSQKENAVLDITRADSRHSDQSSVKTIVSFEDAEVTEKEEEETSADNSGYFEEVEEGDKGSPLGANLHKFFPIPATSEIQSTFWNIHPPRVIGEKNSVEIFYDLAKDMGLRSIASLKEQLLSDEVDLRYYGIDPRIVKVLCDALEDNTTVKSLNLKGNWLSVDACFHLQDLLRQNYTLRSLDLSGSHISPRGAKQLGKGLTRTFSLLYLNLSKCDLGTEGLCYVSDAIGQNKSLISLNLSHNSLTSKCEQCLYTILSGNRYLEQLDLSWNLLSHKQTIGHIVKGIMINDNIRDLNLSWNALGAECVDHLRWFLEHSDTLECLNLSYNNFTNNEAEKIAKVIPKNFKLEKLVILNNHIHTQNSAILIQIATKPYGIIEKYLKSQEPDPKRIFLKRAYFEAMNPKKKKLQKNFGHFILSLKDEQVKTTTFQESIRHYKLPLSASLVNEIINAFAVDGLIDQANLKKFYLQEYPDTELPQQGIEHQIKAKKKRKKLKTK